MGATPPGLGGVPPSGCALILTQGVDFWPGGWEATLAVGLTLFLEMSC